MGLTEEFVDAAFEST